MELSDFVLQVAKRERGADSSIVESLLITITCHLEVLNKIKTILEAQHSIGTVLKLE